MELVKANQKIILIYLPNLFYLNQNSKLIQIVSIKDIQIGSKYVILLNYNIKYIFELYSLGQNLMNNFYIEVQLVQNLL